MLRRIVLLAGTLNAAVLALSPPYTTSASGPECRLSDSVTACPTYANCYGSSGCTGSGCPGYCAPTSSCTIGSPNRTCSDPGNSCTPFYTSCTTDGCFGACIQTTDCPEPSTCIPDSPCTTDGCTGNCLYTPTPTPLSPCVISDSVSTCETNSICSQTSPCSTSGCGGLCLPVNTQLPLSPCVISDPAHGCTESGSWTCTQTSPCSTSGCGGLCLSISSPPPSKPCVITSAPTPSGSACKIDDPASSCDQTPYSSCHGASGCTTSGCEGTCTLRQMCDPSTPGVPWGTGMPPAPCPSGQICSVHSGTPFCYTTASVTGGTDSSSSYTPSLPCTFGQSNNCPTCHACAAFPGGCHTSGCVGDCLPVPCATFSPDPTEPSEKTRTYECLVSVTGGCGLGKQCEPYYGPCCDSLNCPGKCVDVGGGCATDIQVTKTVTIYTTSA